MMNVFFKRSVFLAGQSPVWEGGGQSRPAARAGSPEMPSSPPAGLPRSSHHGTHVSSLLFGKGRQCLEPTRPQTPAPPLPRKPLSGSDHDLVFSFPPGPALSATDSLSILL